MEVKANTPKKIDWMKMEPLKHRTIYDELRKERTMRVKMLVSKKGSIDGINVTEYQAGQTYDLTERLGGVFVDNGWAEEIKALEVPPEVKAEPATAEIPVKKKKRRRK